MLIEQNGLGPADWLANRNRPQFLVARLYKISELGHGGL